MNRTTAKCHGLTVNGPPVSRRKLAAAAGLCAVFAAGCSQQPYATPTGPPPAPPAQAIALAASSNCVQATPIVGNALGVLASLRAATLAPAAAQAQLARGLAPIEHLVLTTPDDVTRVALANIYDAFSVFQAFVLNSGAPGYQRAFSNFNGSLAGFHHACSVAGANTAKSAPQDWATPDAGTLLSRPERTTGEARALQVTNTHRAPGTAGFTDELSWAFPTSEGSEQVGLWARALRGRPVLTLLVRELSGTRLAGHGEVSLKLGARSRFEYLVYRVRRPGVSRLSVSIFAAHLPPGGAFVVDNISMVRR